MHLRPLLLGAVLIAPGIARADDCPPPLETACYADPSCDQYCEPEIAAAAYTQPVLAPRLNMADLKGRSLMIHAGGDNHADHPAPLGGGGARVVCGVTP